MSYEYKKEREKLFTSAGLRRVLAIRNTIDTLTTKSRACTIGAAISEQTGVTDSWEFLAAVDFLEEAGHIRTVCPEGRARQDQVILPLWRQ